MADQTNAEVSDERLREIERPWLLVKRGFYWRPEGMGYTAFKAEAGRYTDADAAMIVDEPGEGTSRIRYDDAEEFSPACPDDAKVRMLMVERSRLRDELNRRSVTSQASEGAGEPVAAPNGLSAEQQAVWDAIDVRMQSAPVSGIGATGEFSGALQKQQFTFKQGLAVARLAALNALAPSQPAAVGVTDEMVELTAYELQVLIGTSISGCTMSPGRVFDLNAAWARLYGLGLTDRADGIACPTQLGVARIEAALRSTP